MANTIYTNQSRPEILLQIVAQRKIYSVAKKFDIVNLCLTCVGSVVAVLLSCASIGKGDETIVGVVLFVLALFVRNGRQAGKSKAAKMQQFIDATLYSEAIGCDRKIWGDILVDTEVAVEISKYTESDVRDEKVRGWYPNFSSLDPEQAILMCQKTNIFWDSDLRKGYFMVSVGAFLFVIAIAWAICRVCNSFWLGACFVPAILFWAESLFAYFSDRLRMQQMKTLADEAEHQINDDGRTSVLPTLVRLQKVILENRENSFLVPDWYYQLRRVPQQKQADCLANSIE